MKCSEVSDRFSFFPVALDQVFETQTCHGREEPLQVTTPEWTTHRFYLSDFRSSWTSFFNLKWCFHLRNLETETPLYIQSDQDMPAWGSDALVTSINISIAAKSRGMAQEVWNLITSKSAADFTDCESFLFVHVVGFCLQLVFLWNLVIEGGQSQVWEGWRWKCQVTSALLLFDSSGAFITDYNHQIAKIYRTDSLVQSYAGPQENEEAENEGEEESSANI